LGTDFVAGKNRVPYPAAGNRAFFTILQPFSLLNCGFNCWIPIFPKYFQSKDNERYTLFQLNVWDKLWERTKAPHLPIPPIGGGEGRGRFEEF
jgi:hypothetical protein